MDLVLKRNYSYVALVVTSLICHNGTLTCHKLEIIYFYNKAMLLNFKKGQLKLKLKQNK